MEILYTSRDSGTQKSYLHISYDTTGNIIQKTESYDKDGYKCNQDWLYTYYENGLITKKTESKCYSNGSIASQTTWAYNTAGKVVFKTVDEYDKAGDQTRYEETRYDDKGNLLYVADSVNPRSPDISFTLYDAKKAVICTLISDGEHGAWVRTCDASGKAFENFEDTLIYETKNAAGKPVVEVWVGDNGPGISPWVIYYQYNANGTLKSRTETWYSRNSAGDIQMVVYDANGNIIEGGLM